MSTLIGLLVTLLILAIIVGFAFWILDMLPFPEPPFKQVIKVIVGVIVLLYLLGLLIGYAPLPNHFYR